MYTDYMDYMDADHSKATEWHKDPDICMAGRPCVLIGENPRMFAYLRRALEEGFKPTTMYQAMLVDDIA